MCPRCVDVDAVDEASEADVRDANLGECEPVETECFVIETVRSTLTKGRDARTGVVGGMSTDVEFIENSVNAVLGWADPLSANLDEASDGVGDVVGATPKAVASFEDDDVEAVSCELLGGSEPGHAGTDDDDLGVLLFVHWFAWRKEVGCGSVIRRSLTSSSFRLPWVF